MSIEARQAPATADVQRRLAAFNAARVRPRLDDGDWQEELLTQYDNLRLEMQFVEAARVEIAPMLAEVPADPAAFMRWFAGLRDTGPGQHDALFPWLAKQASREQMTWFLTQEVAGEAGFDDLVALTQVKMPVQAKLEMARNYWDEMGRGDAKGMHGPMLERLARHLGLAPTSETVVPEALALGNTMLALAMHRRYAYQSVGALGAIELTAPTRAGFVNTALRRLGVPPKQTHYFALHAVLDVKHAEAWNREVILPLVREDPARIRPIAEGALLRLVCGARCFERYRREFGLVSS